VHLAQSPLQGQEAIRRKSALAFGPTINCGGWGGGGEKEAVLDYPEI
jgi:hypothetical protein